MLQQSIATACLLVFSLGSFQLAGAAMADQAHHTVVPGDAVKWGPAPPSLPKGAEAAILLGNPAQEGPFVLRLKFPDGFTVPPHRHSKDEFVTVIAGKFAVAAGEKVDRAEAKPLPAQRLGPPPAGMAAD